MAAPAFEIKKLSDLGGLKRSLSLTVPAAEVQIRLSQRLKRRQKQARLPGFRPGKAPMNVIERKYGAAEQSEAAIEATQEACLQAVSDREIELATQLRIVEMSGDGKAEDISATAEFEIYPQVQLMPLEEMQLKLQSFRIDKEDIDAMLEDWRRQAVQYEAEDGRSAAKDDRLKLQLRMSIVGEESAENPEPQDNPEPQEVYALVGGGHFPAELEEAFVGLKAGESRKVSAAVPAQRMTEGATEGVTEAGSEASDKEPSAGSAERRVQYQFEVLEVARPEKPTLEELAKSLEVGEGEDAMSLLRQRCREQLESRCGGITDEKNRDAVFEQLLANSEAELPETLLANEVELLKQRTAPRLGLDPQKLEGKPLDEIKAQAERRVHLSILLRALGKKYDLSPSTDHIQQVIGREAMRYPQPQEFVKWAVGNEDYLRQARAQAFEKMAADLVLDKAQRDEEEVSARELIGLESAAADTSAAQQ